MYHFIFFLALCLFFNVFCMHEKRERDEDALFFEKIVDTSQGRGFTISDDEPSVKHRKFCVGRCKNPGCTFESDSADVLEKHQHECILSPFFMNCRGLNLLSEALPVPDEQRPTMLDEFIVNFQKLLQKFGLNTVSMSVFSRFLSSIQDEQKKRQLILDALCSHITSTKIDLFHCPLCAETSKERGFIERHLRDDHSSFDQEKSIERKK